MNIRTRFLLFFLLGSLGAIAVNAASRFYLYPYLNFIETDEIGYGVTAAYAWTAHDRVLLGVEGFQYDDTRGTSGPFTAEVTEFTGDTWEIKLGYLRRLNDPAQSVGLHIGPSVGIQFFDSEFRSRSFDPTQFTIVEADMDDDPSWNLYLNLLADYQLPGGFNLFLVVSPGYSFERDFEIQYSTGDERTVSGTVEDDFFWNISTGLGWSF